MFSQCKCETRAQVNLKYTCIKHVCLPAAFSYWCWTQPWASWCPWRCLKSCRFPPRPFLSAPPPPCSISPHEEPTLLPAWGQNIKVRRGGGVVASINKSKLTQNLFRFFAHLFSLIWGHTSALPTLPQRPSTSVLSHERARNGTRTLHGTAAFGFKGALLSPPRYQTGTYWATFSMGTQKTGGCWIGAPGASSWCGQYFRERVTSSWPSWSVCLLHRLLRLEDSNLARRDTKKKS